MKNAKFALVVFLGAVLIVGGLRLVAQGASLDTIKAAAQREGVVNCFGSPITPQDVKQLEDAFNKYYRLKLRLVYEPSQAVGVKVAQMLLAARGGVKPENDFGTINSEGIDSLARAGLLRDDVDWPRIFSHISSDWVVNDNRGLIFWHGVFGPIYNSNIVPPDQVPTTWEDLLAPRWKGTLLSSTTVEPWNALSETWGVEKVSNFLKELRKQNLSFQSGNSQTLQRIAAGEFPIAVSSYYGITLRLQKKGAPLKFIFLEPVPISPMYLALFKNSPHPNAGMLFAAWLLSSEGNALWEEMSGFSSIYVKGSKQQAALVGKNYSMLKVKTAVERGAELAERWSKILGITQ